MGYPRQRVCPPCVSGESLLAHSEILRSAGPYHHYTFELFALDTKLDLTEAASRAEVMKAIDGHIIGKAVLEGRFHQ